MMVRQDQGLVGSWGRRGWRQWWILDMSKVQIALNKLEDIFKTVHGECVQAPVQQVSPVKHLPSSNMFKEETKMKFQDWFDGL